MTYPDLITCLNESASTVWHVLHFLLLGDIVPSHLGHDILYSLFRFDELGKIGLTVADLFFADCDTGPILSGHLCGLDNERRALTTKDIGTQPRRLTNEGFYPRRVFGLDHLDYLWNH